MKKQRGKKNGFQPVNRTASEPGQSLNVDLCFVPADHEAEIKLPAVSGSSGKLVVERPAAEQRERWYPGCIFADEGLSYEAAMVQFVADSRSEPEGVPVKQSPEAVARTEAKAEKKVLRQIEEVLKVARRQQRQQRQVENAAWQEAQAERRQQEARDRQRAEGVKLAYGSQKAQDEEFIHVLIARHRPQPNGIAERFVRTLKEWLKNKPWQSPEELESLLHWFLSEYNDRPHQGLPVPGLSPNEFAKRLWVT